MNRSDSLTKIAPALVRALAKIEGAAKKKVNAGFKSKYANLEAVIDASKDILAEHGLTLIQLPGPLVSGVLTLETILLHESGEFISGEFGIALGKNDPQGVGSALSYARRYAQMAALNMPAVDDDAEAAMGRGQHAPQQPPNSPVRDTPGRPRLSSAEAKREGLHEKFEEELHTIKNEDALDVFIRQRLPVHKSQVPMSWLEPMDDAVEKHRDTIKQEAEFRPPSA